MLEFISYFILGVSTVLIGVTNSLLLKPKNGVKSIIFFSVLIFVFMQTVMVLSQHRLFEVSAFKTVAAGVFFFTGTICFFDGKIIDKVFSISISLGLQFMADMLGSALLSWSIKDFIAKAKRDENLYLIGQVFYLIFHFLLVGILVFIILRRKGYFNINFLRPFALFPLTQLPYVIFYFLSISNNQLMWSGRLLLLVFFCLITNATILHGMREIEKKERLEEQVRNYEERMRIQLMHYVELAEYHEVLQRTRHDFNNLMQVIEILVRTGTVDEAIRMLRRAESEMEDLESILRTEAGFRYEER